MNCSFIFKSKRHYIVQILTIKNCRKCKTKIKKSFTKILTIILSVNIVLTLRVKLPCPKCKILIVREEILVLSFIVSDKNRKKDPGAPPYIIYILYIVNSNCLCGYVNDTPEHYFSHCYRFSVMRIIMLFEINKLNLIKSDRWL
jgi:hypothetical protein